MTPDKDAFNSYTFSAEDIDLLHTYLSSDVMRTYLSSTYAQMRDELLANTGSPFAAESANAEATLAFLAGAQDYLTQVLRIGDSDVIS